MTAEGTEVGSAFVSIVPSARGFSGKLQKSIDGEVASAGDKAGKTFGQRFGAAVKSPLGALGSTLGGFAAGSFLSGAIGEASDLAEAGNKLRTIFGPATKDLEAFASDGAESLGQSKLAVLDAASTFGVYGKAAGLAGRDNAAFAKQFSGLSADLASFYNTSPEEAVNALGSALRGEAEPLRKYGVLLDDATMRQEAVRLGLVKTTKQALTPQQKVLAAQAVILKQTQVAQGDFAKTSGGLANQQRILSAEFTNAKASLGSALLPAMTAGANFITGTFIPGIRATAGFVRENSTAFKILGITVAAIGAGLLIYRGTVAVVTTVTKGWTIAQKLLNLQLRLNPIGLVITGLALLAAGLILAYKKSETFRNIVNSVGNALLGAGEWVVSLAGNVKDLWLKWTPLGQVLSHAPEIIGGVGTAFSAVRDFIGEVIGKVQSLIEWIGKIPKPDLGFVGDIAGKIPGLAGGGTVTSSGLTLVGESGPEVLDLRRGSRVVPLERAGNASGGERHLHIHQEAGDSIGTSLRELVALERALVA